MPLIEYFTLSSFHSFPEKNCGLSLLDYTATLEVKGRLVPELEGLGYHEQYSSPPNSSTKWPIFFFFLIKISMSAGWIKKIWYSSSPSSSTRKNGRSLYCSETVFLDKLFLKLMVMGHFARLSLTTLNCMCRHLQEVVCLCFR